MTSFVWDNPVKVLILYSHSFFRAFHSVSYEWVYVLYIFFISLIINTLLSDFKYLFRFVLSLYSIMLNYKV
jgi:hypothetical protein